MKNTLAFNKIGMLAWIWFVVIHGIFMGSVYFINDINPISKNADYSPMISCIFGIHNQFPPVVGFGFYFITYCTTEILKFMLLPMPLSNFKHFIITHKRAK